MKRILLLALFIIACKFTFCQDYIYFNDKKYESTPTWKFYIQNYMWNVSDLEGCIGKNDAGSGMLLLSASVPSITYKIQDTVLIVLTDSGKIVCLDKNFSFSENGKTSSLYDLSNADIEKLGSPVNSVKVCQNVH